MFVDNYNRMGRILGPCVFSHLSILGSSSSGVYQNTNIYKAILYHYLPLQRVNRYSPKASIETNQITYDINKKT